MRVHVCVCSSDRGQDGSIRGSQWNRLREQDPREGSDELAFQLPLRDRPLQRLLPTQSACIDHEMVTCL
jgi:hypothetical protein